MRDGGLVRDRSMVEEKITFANCRGETLSGVLHHPAQDPVRGSVILCHGMESGKSSDKLVLLSHTLTGFGLVALRFDFSYVGESSARFEDITYGGEVDDLMAAHALMRARHGGNIAVFGSSMGGTVALLFAAQESRISALVVVAAPFHPENFPKRLLTPVELRLWRERGFILYNGRRLNRSLLDELQSLDLAAAAKQIRCPVLIIHGDADETVPVAEAHELYAVLGGKKRLVILQGADHRLSDPSMMRRAMTAALDWLVEHV